MIFDDYSTIDEVFEEERDFVKQELNEAELYTNAVRALGYDEIGIYVMDRGWNEQMRLASHNDNETGEIIEIVDHFEDRSPGITVAAKESTLMEILHNMNYVKEHPFRSFFRYASCFRPGRLRDIAELARLTLHVREIFGK